MAKYLAIGVGSPNDKKELEKGLPLLDGKTIEQHFTDTDIRLLKDGPLEVSCHRTPKRAEAYARDLQKMTEQDQVVALLFGGLSFALPGIFSSHTSSLPIIGVPAYSSSTHGGGLDSLTAVSNIPEGTVVGGAPLHHPDHPSLDKAVLIAEKILNMDSPGVHIIAPTSHKQTDAIRQILNPPKGRSDNDTKGVFGIGYLQRVEPIGGEKYDLAITVSENNSILTTCDRVSSIALQCMVPRSYPGAPSEGAKKRMKYNDFIETVLTLDRTQNTLYFAKAKNAALFLARCMSLHNPGIRDLLLTYHAQKQKETEDKYKITDEEKEKGPHRLSRADFG
jgi:phosphoribosylcarboxyaminoimidazole (NCAIR) mutase